MNLNHPVNLGKVCLPPILNILPQHDYYAPPTDYRRPCLLRLYSYNSKYLPTPLPPAASLQTAHYVLAPSAYGYYSYDQRQPQQLLVLQVQAPVLPPLPVPVLQKHKSYPPGPAAPPSPSSVVLTPRQQEKSVLPTAQAALPATLASYQPQALRRKTRNNLPKETTYILLKWLNEHLNHPYPNLFEKNQLIASTGLNQQQLLNWFINARRRKIKVLKKQQKLGYGADAASSSSSDDDDGNI